MGNKMKNEEDIIRTLVDRELAKASQIIPTADLNERLALKLDSEHAGRIKRRSRFLKPVPVLALALLIIIAAFMIRQAFFPSRHVLGLRISLSHYLLMSPSIWPTAAEQDHYVGVHSQSRILSWQDASSYEQMFRNMFPLEAQVNVWPPPSVPKSGPTALSLQETIRILYFDRSLDKFLLKYFKKYQEV